MNTLSETILFQQDIIDELHDKVQLYKLFIVLLALVVVILLAMILTQANVQRQNHRPHLVDRGYTAPFPGSHSPNPPPPKPKMPDNTVSKYEEKPA